jgi:hypothetical protein
LKCEVYRPRLQLVIQCYRQYKPEQIQEVISVIGLMVCQSFH